MKRLLSEVRLYPPQFWLITCGVLLSSMGSSLVWPFQLIYISKTLGQPLASTATLISVSSLAGLSVSLLGGAVADRLGRKPLMALAQGIHGAAYLLMNSARSYGAFLLPMTLMGIAGPFYSTASDAMMADLLPAERRTSGYSILRMVNNAGIALGPGIGGWLVTRSYSLAFYGAASGMLFYGLLLMIFARETLQWRGEEKKKNEGLFAGFGLVLGDRAFMGFVAAAALGMIAPLMMWTLLAVYTNGEFGLAESQYSWLPITNALMCVFVQYPVTLVTRRFSAPRMIALGMLVYALGVGSVALMSSFWGFWASMVVITLGELIFVPTASAYVANRAPEALRGRYMSFYWLTWSLARALAPVLGGALHDQIAPKAIWLGGLSFGLLSALLLFALARRGQKNA